MDLKVRLIHGVVEFFVTPASVDTSAIPLDLAVHHSNSLNCVIWHLKERCIAAIIPNHQIGTQSLSRVLKII